jgi:PAS domain S-box-containing protein
MIVTPVRRLAGLLVLLIGGRWLALSAALLLVVLGGLVQAGFHAGLYGAAAQYALFAAGSLAVFLAFIWRGAQARLEGERERAAAIQEPREWLQVEQREWLQVALASIGDAVIATDARGRVIFMNAVAESLTGWRQSAAAGQPLIEVFRIVHQQTRQLVENPAEQVLRDGTIAGLANHTVLIARDGTERPIEDSAAPIRDAAGAVRGVVLIFRDITERRRAEAALRDAEARYEDLYQHAPDPMASVDATSGTVLQCNQTLADVVGRAPMEIIGRPVYELYHPNSLPAAQAAAQTFLTAGEVRDVELQLRPMDGSRVDVTLNVTAVRDAQGRIVRGRSVWRDITARKRAEAQRDARRQVAEALGDVARLLAQSLDPPVIAQRIVDSICPLVRCKLAVVYQLDSDSEELVAAAVSGDPGPLWGPRIALPKGMGSIGIAVSERRPVASPDILKDPMIRLTPAMRERITAATYRSVLALPLMIHGRVIGAIGLGDEAGRDFTEDDIWLGQVFADQAAVALNNAQQYRDAQRAREEAEAANQAKDEFLATLSHELRTPLNAMLGWVKLLRSGVLDAAGAARALEVIERNIFSQSQLITDLLDVSRIIVGKMTLELGPVVLPRVLEAANDALRPAAAAKRITVTLELDRGIPPIVGDAHRLQQVFWNLLSNAVKFTPEDGKVNLRLTKADGFARIIVADSGRGISPDFLPRLFERFRQADSSTTRAHAGLGLGLAIVHHFVELHGGRVTAASAGEDQGATFTVDLPLRGAGPAAMIEPSWIEPAAATADDRLRGVAVLVVDDHADTCELLATLLGRAGAAVTAATSAREARRSLRTTRLDVILCDLAMPEEDGLTFIRDLRTWRPEQGGQLPAVALTAYARPEDRQQALAGGFQDYLTKPIDPARLIDAVSRLTGR